MRRSHRAVLVLHLVVTGADELAIRRDEPDVAEDIISHRASVCAGERRRHPAHADPVRLPKAVV